MIRLERIPCPTDLSEDSERTLRYAVALARVSGAKLFVSQWARRTLRRRVRHAFAALAGYGLVR
jgi:hypothetical protein